MARFFFVLVSVALLATPAAAQRRPVDGSPPVTTGKESQPQPTTLESLFSQLRAAKDPAEGRAIARQIEQRWMRSPSDTATLLMDRVVKAMAANSNETALELLDHLMQLQPQWAEAYNKRATVLFVMDDYDGALRDIRATLAREPRHFGALAGLGMIMQRLGNKKAAYAAFSRALDMHPQLNEVREVVDRLRPDVEGRAL
jgi:tetratricopeptide (TPR) repeat protein